MRASEKKRACKRKVDTNISYNFANACPFLLFICKCFIPHCLVLSADNLKAARSKAYSASNAKPISVHTRRTSLRMASKVFIKKQINVARSDLRKTDMKANPAYRKTACFKTVCTYLQKLTVRMYKKWKIKKPNHISSQSKASLQH